MQRHISESYAEYMAGKTYLYQTALGLDLDAAGTFLIWQLPHMATAPYGNCLIWQPL